MLRKQINKGLISLKSQNVISKGKGGRRYLPYAFTQDGIAMLSSVLKSEKAIQVNIQIIRTFNRLRRIIAENKDLRKKIAEIENRYSAKFSNVDKNIDILMCFSSFIYGI